MEEAGVQGPIDPTALLHPYPVPGREESRWYKAAKPRLRGTLLEALTTSLYPQVQGLAYRAVGFWTALSIVAACICYFGLFPKTLPNSKASKAWRRSGLG